MARKIHAVYISFDEARGLIPIFEYYVKEGPWKEVRLDARAVLDELRDVRPVDYSPLGGKQVFLTERQYEFFNDVRDEVDK